MRILIFGADGISSVIGAFLARSGHDISLVGSAAHLDAIEKSGLRVSGAWGSFRTKAFELYRSLPEIPSEEAPFDIIFFTGGSQGAAQAKNEIARYLGDKTVFVPLENSFGKVIEPGHVKVSAVPSPIVAVKEIADILSEAGIAAIPAK